MKIRELILVTLLTIAKGYFGMKGFPILLLIYSSISVVIGVKYGIKYNIINMLVSSAALSAVLGITYLPIFLMYLGLSVILNRGIDSGERISKTVMAGSSYLFITATIALMVSKLYFRVDFLSILNGTIETNINSSLKELKAMNGDIIAIKAVMEQSIQFINIAFPGIVILLTLAISAASYGIANYIIRRNGIKNITPMRLSDFKLSNKFTAAAAIILLVVFGIRFMDLGLYERLVVNLIFILYSLLFVQGLAIASYLMGKSNLNWILKFIIIFFLIINMTLGKFIILIGVLDILFNFRKIKED